MLGDRKRQTLLQFSDASAELCAPYQDQAKIGVMKEEVDVPTALLERDFPLSLQVEICWETKTDSGSVLRCYCRALCPLPRSGKNWCTERES